jgi:hypothetical protein
MDTEKTMPQYVTVTRSYTYDTKEIIQSLQEVLGIENPTWEDVEEQITKWAYEDHESPISKRDLVWIDQNGRDI